LGNRAGTAVIAVLVALAASGPSGRSVGEREIALGYTTHAALTRVVRSGDAVLVRDLRPLHVAEVRTRDVRGLRRAAGIRFAHTLSPRTDARVVAAAPEWQRTATHADAVPESVLHAAAAVKIAVVDTGADVAAPDLAAKSPETWNTRTGSSDVRDSNGHGTFVASLAAGSSTGAGGDAQLLAVKSGSDGGSFTDMDEAAGITYAVDHGARILNLSVGGPRTSPTERRAIQYAIDRGVLVVASVGNEYGEHNPVEYPAALVQPVGSNGVGGAGLAVTASGPDGRRASYANTGSWVSLAAPGEHVLGAVSAASSPLLYPRATVAPGKPGLYGYGSGTSFAAPQVAGAAALVWAANPSLTAQQVAQILKETASGAGRWTPELGFGVVDVAAAVARAQQGASGVLLSGRRHKLRATLNWGGTAASYTLTMNNRALLTATTSTTTTVGLRKGKTYSFVVSALDANGVVTAKSAVVKFVVK
jgi:subtilisin family serine protease